jgi:hypothetical protein
MAHQNAAYRSLKRRRPRHPHPEGSQGGVCEDAIAGKLSPECRIVKQVCTGIKFLRHVVLGDAIARQFRDGGMNG